MGSKQSDFSVLAKKIAGKFQMLPQVEAIALGGSLAKGYTDKLSDIDLYIYINEAIPLNFRQNIINTLGSSRTDLNLTFWDSGDQWIDLNTGIEVDIIYWNKAWIREQIDHVLVNHQASVGYSTCFWHTVLNSTLLFDRNVIPSYFNQINKAIERNDVISINHKVAALLASYFDVLFAINYLPNPGEKKLLRFTLENCEKKPKNIKKQVENVLDAGSIKVKQLPDRITDLLDGLDELLVSEDIEPKKTLSI